MQSGESRPAYSKAGTVPLSAPKVYGDNRCAHCGSTDEEMGTCKQCGWRRDALRGLKGPNPYFDRVPVGWLEDLEQESISNKEEIALLKNQIGLAAFEGHPKNAMQRRLEEKRIRVELIEQEAESLCEQCEMLQKNIQTLAAKRDDALGKMEALKYRVVKVKQRRDYETYGTTAQESSSSKMS